MGTGCSDLGNKIPVVTAMGESAEVAAVEELGLVRVVGSAAIVLSCRHELGKPSSAALISSRLQEENSRTT